MRVFDLFHHTDIVKLDVEVLIDRLQRPADLDVVLELDRYFLVDKSLEETRQRLTHTLKMVI